MRSPFPKTSFWRISLSLYILYIPKTSFWRISLSLYIYYIYILCLYTTNIVMYSMYTLKKHITFWYTFWWFNSGLPLKQSVFCWTLKEPCDLFSSQAVTYQKAYPTEPFRHMMCAPGSLGFVKSNGERCGGRRLRKMVSIGSWNSDRLWMEEILHHLWWLKPSKQWDKPPINWCRISSIHPM